VVILSSSKEKQDIDKSYPLGANALVVNPVESWQFLETTGQLWVFWAVINIVPDNQ